MNNERTGQKRKRREKRRKGKVFVGPRSNGGARSSVRESVQRSLSQVGVTAAVICGK